MIKSEYYDKYPSDFNPLCRRKTETDTEYFERRDLYRKHINDCLNRHENEKWSDMDHWYVPNKYNKKYSFLRPHCITYVCDIVADAPTSWGLTRMYIPYFERTKGKRVSKFDCYPHMFLDKDTNKMGEILGFEFENKEGYIEARFYHIVDDKTIPLSAYYGTCNDPKQFFAYVQDNYELVCSRSIHDENTFNKGSLKAYCVFTTGAKKKYLYGPME